MGFLLGTLLSYLLLYKYLALFIVVFAAGIILPLPVNTLLVATGAFASQGIFNFGISLGVGMLANVLGDGFDYMLTRKFRYAIVKEKYIRKFPYFTKIERYMREYAGLTIFFTRFLGTPGTLVNFLAGLSGVSLPRFLTFDILGNLCDIGGCLLIGYELGIYWQSYSNLFAIIGGIFLVGSLIFAVSLVFRRNGK